MNPRLSCRRPFVLTPFALLAALLWLGLAQAPRPVQAQSRPPNILFLILDDVGIDQLAAFNPAAPSAPQTPNMNAIIGAGVKFSNFWTMPECSPSRACFLTGRYPLRTGVDVAFTPADQTAAQVSRFETTTPMVLRTAGYTSALVGKFHLAGPDNNPDGYRTPAVLGWDYYNGILYGSPAAIDVTLGGQIQDKSRYPCGFPTGSQKGVGWFQSADGQIRCDGNQGQGYTGQECVAKGGIPALDANGNFARTCSQAVHTPDFTKLNGYYVMPNVVNDGDQFRQSRSRGYGTTLQTNAAIDWIERQSQGQNTSKPWMCTVSYSAIHAPYQQPPTDLYPPGFVWPKEVPEDSMNLLAQRIMSNLMLEAMDKEIGRLLVSTGLARRGPAGELIYRPEATNTMIVLVGDNGTYLPSVKFPYDPIRAKATPYETGVRTPLAIAGPLVRQPGRSVAKMVSCVDLFQLFGEIAGVNVRAVVPASHILDSQPVLPYLTNPNQPGIRRYNFTQAGSGVKSPATQMTIGACVIAVGASQEHGTFVATDKLIFNKSLCEAEGGVWYGPVPPDQAAQYNDACAVRAADIYPNLTILPDVVWAIRNQRYKLVKVKRAPCDQDKGEFEFYDLTPKPVLNPVGLDLTTSDLLTKGQPTNLNAEQLANYQELMQALTSLLNSEPLCYGDGNLDKVVDQQDVDGVKQYWGQPSWFDFNHDGTTDQKDLDCVQANLGHDGLAGQSGAPCN
jgi:arylsulfatase A-like enzyme